MFWLLIEIRQRTHIKPCKKHPVFIAENIDFLKERPDWNIIVKGLYARRERGRQ